MVQSASVAERLGGDELFRDVVRTAQLTGRESVYERRAPDRDAIDVAIPGGRGHVYLQFVSDEVGQIKLHDTPPDL